MHLTQKYNRKNCQSTWDLIHEAWKINDLKQMKEACHELITEARLKNTTDYRWRQTVDNARDKDKLFISITNLHHQDSTETATR